MVVKDEKGNAQLKMNPGSDYVIPDSCVASRGLTAATPVEIPIAAAIPRSLLQLQSLRRSLLQL